MSDFASRPEPTHPARRAILWGGLAAGTGDIVAAFIYYGLRHGASPQGVLHSVAGGLLGNASARAGGWATAALGLLLHFLIATGAAATFWAVTRRWRWPVLHPLPGGLLCGCLVYLVMNQLVLPLSAHHAPFTTLRFDLGGWLIHLAFVGLPIAGIAHHFDRSFR